MKRNDLAKSDLLDLLTGVKDLLKQIQDQLTAQDMRITHIEHYLAEEVVAMFAAGEQDPALDQEENEQPGRTE